MPRTYSHSALKTFQRCQRKWAYVYIDRIVPEDKPVALQKGIELHELLAAYYTVDVHAFLPDTDNEEYADLIYAYDNKWSEADKEWEIISVEEEYFLTVGPYEIVFKPDMVVQINGEVWIVDHKTTANIPDEWDPYNMGDFQHLLYVAGMQQQGYNVAGFIFNYIRTKPPTEPTLIKDGSRIANVRKIDTDYNTLEAYAAVHSQLDHPDVKERLLILKHAPDKFFQRHFLPVNQAAVDNAIKDIGFAVHQMWEAEERKYYPRHVVAGFGGSMSCARCPYQPICHAELLGIDADPATFGYIEKPRREST